MASSLCRIAEIRKLCHSHISHTFGVTLPAKYFIQSSVLLRQIDRQIVSGVSEGLNTFSSDTGPRGTLLLSPDPEDEATTIQLTVANYLPVDKAYYPTVRTPSATTLWEPVTSVVRNVTPCSLVVIDVSGGGIS
jgi:hypothetical protein